MNKFRVTYSQKNPPSSYSYIIQIDGDGVWDEDVESAILKSQKLFTKTNIDSFKRNVETLTRKCRECNRVFESDHHIVLDVCPTCLARDFKDKNYLTWCPLCLKGVITKTKEDAESFIQLHKGHDE